MLYLLLRASASNQLQMAVVDKTQNNGKELTQLFELQDFHFRVTSVSFRSISSHPLCPLSLSRSLWRQTLDLLVGRSLLLSG